MSALSFYTSACRYVLGCAESSENYILLLQEVMVPLRFYLSCRVCNKLLQEPMSPDHTACQHTVCSSCIGGKMRLKPACGWCQGYQNFKHNEFLVSLLSCYAKLCQYILHSPHYNKQVLLIEKSPDQEIQNCRENLSRILKEGIDYQPIVTTTGSSSLAPLARDLTTTSTENSPKQASPNETHEFQVQQSPNEIRESIADCSIVERLGYPKRRSLDDDCAEEEQESNADSFNGKRVKMYDRIKVDKKGCGCGTTSASPGKLTCYGQRCPCYSSHSPCVACRCRGCRNPNKLTKIQQSSEDTDNEIHID